MTQVSGEIAILRHRIRGADGNKAPLLIGGFEAKRIAQATSARGAENTLFVTVTPSIDWEPCLLYTSPSPRDKRQSRMPSSA